MGDAPALPESRRELGPGADDCVSSQAGVSSGLIQKFAFARQQSWCERRRETVLDDEAVALRGQRAGAGARRELERDDRSEDERRAGGL
jgi:hypothetical protein